MFEEKFFGSDIVSSSQYRDFVTRAADLLTSALPAAPYAGPGPAVLKNLLNRPVGPRHSRDFDSALDDLAAIIRHSVGLWHPHVAAHLHTPVLNASLAAEMVISALNQSMDSFDQAPAATVIEQQVVRWLCTLVGFQEKSSGTFTAGGTQSNYMGLLLARDRFADRQWRWCVRTSGLPPEASKMRILCSELAHFSVEKSAIQLGLGTDAVVKVPVDHDFRMCSRTLRQRVLDLQDAGLAPFAIVATAGTTDFGSIDPLNEITELAQEYGLWLHVDAAYGGALLLTQRHRSTLSGIERADSITIDFHKAFFQPISCGAFLLADGENFRHIRVNADYLNPENHEADGIPDLVTNSVLTTRRFDALKLWFSFQVQGVEGMAQLVERIIDSARAAAELIRAHPSLELLNTPAFGCVIFRYWPELSPNNIDAINEAIPRRLFNAGKAVIGHTIVAGHPCLKLTLSNPCVEQNRIAELLDIVVRMGHSIAQAD